MNRSTASPGGRLRRQWWVLAGSLLLFGAVLAVALCREFLAVTAHEEDRLQSQSGTVVENLERQLEGVSRALAAVGDAAAAGALASSTGRREAGAWLSTLADAMPGVRTICILDAQGTVVAASREELLGRNFRHREHFDVPRRSADRTRTYVAAPVETSADAAVVVVGRAVPGRGGGFAGVITATLDPAYFEVVLRSVVYAGDMRTALVRGDGKAFIGASGPADDEGRLRAMRILSGPHLHMDEPLAVLLSRDRSAVLRPWWDKVARFMAFFAVVAAGACWSLYASQRRRVILARLADEALRERQEAAERLRKSEQRLSLALDGSGLALFDWDIAAGMIFHSAQVAALRGGEPAQAWLSPEESRRHVHPDDLDGMLTRIQDAITGACELYHSEFRLKTLAGSWVWVRASGRVVERDAHGRALRLAGTYANVNERKLAEDRLRHLAESDALTDLPNRALFQDRLRQAMLRTPRMGPLALLFLDIDRFKTINDTLGHEAGDQLLKVFARRMRATVRQSDTVARLAGDEFTIILEGVGDMASAKAVAAKLVAALREPVVLAGRQQRVTASIGVAMPLAGDADDALLRRADVALYEAKRRGRDGYFGEDETMGGSMAARSEPPSHPVH